MSKRDEILKANQARQAERMKEEKSVQNSVVDDVINNLEQTTSGSNETKAEDFKPTPEPVEEVNRKEIDMPEMTNIPKVLNTNQEAGVLISMKIPKSVYEMLQVCKKGYNNNQTACVRNLIIKEYKANGEKYKELPEIY